MTILLYVLVAAGYLGLAAWAWKAAVAGAGSAAQDAPSSPGFPAAGALPGSARSNVHAAHAELADIAGLPGRGSGAVLAGFSSAGELQSAPRAQPGIVDNGRGARASDSMTVAERALLVVVWAAHAWLIREAVFSEGDVWFGFAVALSATMWLAIAVVWVESLQYGLASMRLVVLPLAALCSLLPLWFPGIAGLAGTNLNTGADSGTRYAALHDWKFELHLVVALAAYGILTIAALQALLMASLERWLHSHTDRHADGDVWTAGRPDPVAHPGLWARTHDAILGCLPPLLTLERLLFRLVGAGFVLLTLTVVTGAAFSEDLFGRPMRFDHKTVFTIVSWLIFGALLVGRHFRGWRGRVALRWTLSGFVAMLLAYVGSRFVLEVVLHRV